MSKLKSAYELASERIISSRYIGTKEDDEDNFQFDFVNIPEFSDKKDVVLESNETKLITEDNEDNEVKKKEEEMPKIKIKEPYSVSYDEIMEVLWNGHFMDYGGFARLNRTMAFGLSNRNVRVKIEIEPYLNHVNNATKEQLEELSRSVVSPESPKVFGVTVPTNLGHAGRKIVYTMIETSDKAHKDYIGKLNLADEIWVASEYGKKTLQQSGIHVPVAVMPLGVDTSRYNSKSETMDFGDTGSFKFLSVFRWSYRKGYDVLLKSYLEEFSSSDDVSLILVSRAVECSEENSVNKIIEDFSSVKEQVNKKDDEFPHVALYTKTIKEKDMPKVYNSANAFVLISRGEGFCLPVIEAASCGLPVIASNVTAQTDFLNNDNSFLVDPDGYTESSIGGNSSRMAKLCHFYEGQIFPDFGKKAIEKTKEHMRYVFENYNLAKRKATKLHNLVVNNYTWDMAVDRVYNRLKEMYK